MRKVANIMMLLNGIFSIVGVVTVVACGIIFILMGTPVFTDLLQRIISLFETYLPESISPEMIMIMMRTTFISSGVCMMLSCIPMGILANLSFKARDNHSRGLYLAVIIMSAILEIEFGIIGGIFGLIANRKNVV